MTTKLPPISFGTSGHRGIIGESFTTHHCRAIAIGVADVLKRHRQNPTVVIGCDPRTGNSLTLEPDSFTHTLITTLNACGVNTVSYSTVAPTPLISWAITAYGYAGGLILTASHNPSTYNGLKFNDAAGAPAAVATTTHIGHVANAFLLHPSLPESSHRGTHRTLPLPTLAFCESLHRAIATMGIPIPQTLQTGFQVDVKHGTCGAVWQTLRDHYGYPIDILHPDPRSDFGACNPNPTHPPDLPFCSSTHLFSAGNDPDGDRHGVIDSQQTPVAAEDTALIIAHFLHNTQHPPQLICSTLASSMRLSAFCNATDIQYQETAIGFKYFTPYLQQGKDSNATILAVESSGGFSTSTHTLEKCGFLPLLCLAFICEHTQQPLHALKQALTCYGHWQFSEEAYPFSAAKTSLIKKTLATINQDTLTTTLSLPIQKINQDDGLKIHLAHSWVLCRLSGTEPVCRLYSEAPTLKDCKALIQTVRTWLDSL